MDNPINYAIRQVTEEIPEEILRYALIKTESIFQSVIVSLDHVIKEVLTETALVDCKLKGGVRDYIKINPSNIKAFRKEGDTENRYLIRFSNEELSGRSLLSPLFIINNTLDGGVPDTTRSSAGLLGDASELISDYSRSSTGCQINRIRLISDNAVVVEDNVSMLRGNMYLYAVMSDDALMSGLNPKSYMAFADICVLAVKNRIYQQRARLAGDQISGGVAVSEFKAIIEEYRDARDIYKEKLKKEWPEISMLNDPKFRKRHFKSITPGR